MRVRIRESDGVDQRSEELDGRGLRSVEQRSGGSVLRVRVVQDGASRGIEGRVEEKQRSAGQGCAIMIDRDRSSNERRLDRSKGSVGRSIVA